MFICDGEMNRIPAICDCPAESLTLTTDMSPSMVGQGTDDAGIVSVEIEGPKTDASKSAATPTVGLAAETTVNSCWASPIQLRPEAIENRRRILRIRDMTIY